MTQTKTKTKSKRATVSISRPSYGSNGEQHFALYDFISPLDVRYYALDSSLFDILRPYLSESATLRYQMLVELALIVELEECGIAPVGISDRLATALNDVTPGEIYKEEERIHHNVRALVNCLRSRLPESDRGFVHLFATSNDVMDTARAVAYKDVVRDVVIPDAKALVDVLINLARKNARVRQIGRTHGRHAEPITVGYWLANFISRLTERIENLSRATANLRGKLSGAVGAHNGLALKWPDDPAHFEVSVLNRLGLNPADGSTSTQVIHPEYVTDFMHAVSSTFGVLANIADDFRHLMRSEIEEIRECVDTYVVGSSTMPHKINPKNFENVKSLWKEFMPRMVTVYMDQISEHQRDLTNSASGRFLNEFVFGFDYAVRRLRDAIVCTEMYPSGLEANFVKSTQWIVAEPLYIALALEGHPDPYDAARKLTDRARKSKTSGLLDLLKNDPEAKKLVASIRDKRRRDAILDPSKYVGDSVERTMLVCDDAEQRLANPILMRNLDRPELPPKRKSKHR